MITKADHSKQTSIFPDLPYETTPFNLTLRGRVVLGIGTAVLASVALLSANRFLNATYSSESDATCPIVTVSTTTSEALDDAMGLPSVPGIQSPAAAQQLGALLGPKSAGTQIKVCGDNERVSAQVVGANSIFTTYTVNNDGTHTTKEVS